MSRTFTLSAVGFVALVVLLPYPYGITVWGVGVITMLLLLVDQISNTQPPGAMTGIANALLITTAIVAACGLVLFWVIKDGP